MATMMAPCAAAAVRPAATARTSGLMAHSPLARTQVLPVRLPNSAAPCGHRRLMTALPRLRAAPITDFPSGADRAATGPAAGMATTTVGSVAALVALQAGPLARLALAEEMMGAEEAVDGGSLIATIAFTVAIGALAIVTIGVIYLSAMQFLDKRQELEDQEKLDKAATATVESDKGKKKKNKKKESTRVRDRVAANNGKGFSKKERAKVEQD